MAQALGAALYEEVLIEDGRVVNGTFRNYHVPILADLPRTGVIFADTYDRLGPLGAKSMSESPFNPRPPLPWPTPSSTRPACACMLPRSSRTGSGAPSTMQPPGTGVGETGYECR